MMCTIQVNALYYVSECIRTVSTAVTCSGIGIAGILRNPRETVGMETNVAGFPLGLKQLCAGTSENRMEVLRGWG